MLKTNNYTPIENHLKDISSLDQELLKYFEDIVEIDKNLNRKVVSFQANKKIPKYRWYKFKEAFSANLVNYLLSEYDIHKGIVFDPFAGSGTSLFAVSEKGYDAEGIELLPIGHRIIEARKKAVPKLKNGDIERIIFWKDNKPWEKSKTQQKINTLRITKGAYSEETERSIGKYLVALNREKEVVKEILRFALLCILESISYTRKDGQYLRWDYRAGRRKVRGKFHKGKILEFDQAISMKLKEIVNDLKQVKKQNVLFEEENNIEKGKVILHKGSCLKICPTLKDHKYTALITSPPYCNRYDYTRTYALEHAILGIGEDDLVNLRQEMLSCTVENREKELLDIEKSWNKAIESCETNNLLQAIIKYLEYLKAKKQLNNNGIPRMVKGYFYEMACIIQESYRVLNKNGLMFMVNDNVRYAGASVSVDLILSKIAEDLGFKIEKILVLPNGKGNSSQQMGLHGREPLRKCVYVWRKLG